MLDFFFFFVRGREGERGSHGRPSRDCCSHGEKAEGGNKCDEKGSDFFPSRSLHTRVVEDCTAKAIGRARKEQNHKSSELPSPNPPKKNG